MTQNKRNKKLKSGNVVTLWFMTCYLA